jgi:AGCS family alanine or glycine:cation symporter
MLGWSYYGERCAEFLFGPKVITPYRVLWVVGIYIGTQMQGGIVWKLADILNGMMAFPNLIALLFLSPVVFALTREYFAEEALTSELPK